MTHLKALSLRDVINALFTLTDPDRYAVATAERFPATQDEPADYEVHLFVRDPLKSGIVDLACLARAIENLATQYHTVDSTYDAGTEKGKDIRQSVKIW